MPNQDNISLLLVAIIFLTIFIGAFIVIKKRWINKKATMYRAQFTSQNVYMQYQNLHKKKSIEYMLNQKEEKIQDDDGNDLSRFFQGIE